MTPEEYAQFAADLYDAFIRKNIGVTIANEMTRDVVRMLARTEGADANYLTKLRMGLA